MLASLQGAKTLLAEHPGEETSRERPNFSLVSLPRDGLQPCLPPSKYPCIPVEILADHVHLHCVCTTCFCCWAFGEAVASCCRGQGAGREGVRTGLCCRLCFKQWGLLLPPPTSCSSSTAGCVFAVKQRWREEYVCNYMFLCWIRGARRRLRAGASKGESKGCSSASFPLSRALLVLWPFSGRAKSKAPGRSHCHTFARGPDFGHGRTNCCVARCRGAEPTVLICSTSLLSGSSESWKLFWGRAAGSFERCGQKVFLLGASLAAVCQQQASKTVAFLPGSGNAAALLKTWLIDRHRTPSFFRQRWPCTRRGA